MRRREMGHESRASERDFVQMVQDPVDRVRLASGRYPLHDWHVFGHHQDLRAGQFLHHRIPFDVIRMTMTGEQDFDVPKAESEFFHRLPNQRNVPFEVAVDEDVALRRVDKKRA
jgi:hypothetical protein